MKKLEIVELVDGKNIVPVAYMGCAWCGPERKYLGVARGGATWVFDNDGKNAIKVSLDNLKGGYHELYVIYVNKVLNWLDTIPPTRRK